MIMITEISRFCHLRTWGGLSRFPSLAFQRAFSSKGGDGDSSTVKSPSSQTLESTSTSSSGIRLSRLLSQYATNLGVSRRTAESLIRQGQVTIAGKIIQSPQYLVDPQDLGDTNSRVVKVHGKGIQIDLEQNNEKPIVYAVHKLAGEMVAERDPHGRPSLIERLQRGGVGRLGKNQQFHLKPIGRLDMPTEGLILLTNDGEYAREMELPKNQIHRVYRARIHGELTPSKLERIRKGGVRSSDGVRYGPMKISVERNHTRSTNTWVQLTTSEGKNRMIRNLFSALGGAYGLLPPSCFIHGHHVPDRFTLPSYVATVTRLIRIGYGDYTLQTIPPGMAIEVPYKPLLSHKAKGRPMVTPLRSRTEKDSPNENADANVRWVRSAQ
jgi:23S rRNA pseudouridine2605 synthase